MYLYIFINIANSLFIKYVINNKIIFRNQVTSYSFNHNKINLSNN